jgi:NAD(P)-dependent dehydrogenase (short-subunit alcohol dehydrogenase family)
VRGWPHAGARPHTVDIITKEGGEAFAHVADVTQEAACRGAVDATMARYGRLDCLDNNVGRGAPGDVTPDAGGAMAQHVRFERR